MRQEIKNKGFIALLVVVIIGAATLVMSFYSSMLGVGELDLGYSSQTGSKALAVTDGCVEETLRRIRLNSNYGLSGQVSLSVIDGSCIINISDLGGGQRQIIVLGAIKDYYKKIKVLITISGDAVSGNIIVLNSWEERSD